MRTRTLAGALALALLGSAPLAAQPGYWQQGDRWDSQAFWRGAPESPRERADFLQQRIDRGVASGRLNRREARRSEDELASIRAQARDLRYRNGGRLSWRDREMLNARLDNLAGRIYARQTNGYGYRDRGTYGAGYAGANDDRRFATDYDASRYYRDDPRYQERVLSANDQVYRGSDGRYYCRRSDGTTGLIVGAAGGGVLGNVIDGGHNRVAGTLIGGALGALLGKSIDQNNSDVRCR